MSGAVQESKRVLRRQLREAQRQWTPGERAAGSEELRRRLRQLLLWQNARSVVLYHPLADEPDIWPLAAEVIASGRELGLPRFLAETGSYAPCRVVALPQDLVPGRYGVLEPAAHCVGLDVKHLDLILVPGIGFSLDGVRLGRGKGYYDRLLSEVPGFKCGVAFDCQVVANVPVEPHDTRLNGILTPSRWYALTDQARL